MVRGSRYKVVPALVFWCIMGSPNALAMNHDYKDALGKAILFFEGQRSGKLPWTQRVKWRGDSALSDGESKNVNLSGGYYDAGDNVKFGWPMAYTVALLSWAAIEFSEQINSVGQLDYLRSEIRWGADYILKAHVSPNILYTQVGDGKRDHACWERPEDMDTPRTVIEINTNSPGTEVAADSAAALAAASIVFKGVDPDYSSRLLKHSKSLFRFGDKYRGSYQGSCPFYCPRNIHVTWPCQVRPNIHVGAIVGGPNSNDSFSDLRSDHSHLEPTTYKNAAFVGSVAAFVHENFGQPDQ